MFSRASSSSLFKAFSKPVLKSKSTVRPVIGSPTNFARVTTEAEVLRFNTNSAGLTSTKKDLKPIKKSSTFSSTMSKAFSLKDSSIIQRVKTQLSGFSSAKSNRESITGETWGKTVVGSDTAKMTLNNPRAVRGSRSQDDMHALLREPDPLKTAHSTGNLRAAVISEVTPANEWRRFYPPTAIETPTTAEAGGVKEALSALEANATKPSAKPERPFSQELESYAQTFNLPTLAPQAQRSSTIPTAAEKETVKSASEVIEPLFGYGYKIYKGNIYRANDPSLPT